MRVRTIFSPSWSSSRSRPIRVETLAARVILVLALLVSLAACKPRDYGYGSGYGSGGMAAPASAEDYAGYEVDGVVAEERQSAGRYDYKADLDTKYKDEAPPMDTSVTSTGNVIEPAPMPEPAPEQPAPESASRKVVYTASLQVSVYELDDAMEFAEALPERYGGWVQSRYENQITLRVPADRLREAMSELAALGMVLGKTLQASDVTAEYTDLESRLIVLTQMEEQLVALLAQAKTVEESLKIRQELERVRIELELARARMRTLSELISFSTLTLYLVQRGPLNPEVGGNDPFPWVDELGVESTEYR